MEPGVLGGVGWWGQLTAEVCGCPRDSGVGVAWIGGGRVGWVGMGGPSRADAILVPGVPLVRVGQAARLKKRLITVLPPLRSS
jgi:hypothetical protein